MNILTLSAPAAAHIKTYLLNKGRAGSAIRVSVVRTHCMGGRGFGYNIEEDEIRPGDVVEDSGGVKVAFDRDSAFRLRGATVEYEESLQGGGLRVANPNSSGKCHCGMHDILEAIPEGEARSAGAIS